MIRHLLLIASQALSLLSFLTLTALFSAPAQARLPLATLETLHSFQVVWVGGVLNEFVRSPYFAPNVDYLASQGYFHQTVIHPPTTTSITGNRVFLRDQFLKLYEQNGRLPLLVFAHSKGGLESAATLLWDPSLAEKGIIADVVAIQSPVRANSFYDEMLRPTLKSVEFLSSALVTSLQSLRTQEIQEVIQGSIEKLTPAQRRLLNDRIHYVISSKPQPQLSGVLHKLSVLTDHEDKKYDGLVMKKDMSLPEIGRVMMDLEADHLELLFEGSWVAKDLTGRKAKNFTARLIQQWSALDRNPRSCRNAVR